MDRDDGEDNQPKSNIPESAYSGTSSDEEKEKMNEMNSYVQHKECTSISVPSFDVDSTDKEQEPTCPPSRDQEIIKQQKLIQDTEQTIHQNTTMISRLSKNIKMVEILILVLCL